MRKYVAVPQKVIMYVAVLLLAVSQPLTAFATTEGDIVATEAIPSEMIAAENATAPEPISEEVVPLEGAMQSPAPLTIVEPAPVDPSVNSQGVSEPPLSSEIQTEVIITHEVSSGVASGDAVIDSNTIAGSATSGDALAVATVLNSINSSLSLGDDQKVTSFSKDIIGDVKGDIILYPMLLKSMLEAQAGNQPLSAVDVTTNFDVTNQINLQALSGDATVTRNTQAGGATTGSAAAVANVVNILNSMIATQQSFIGTINIYGNLEGDILLAPDFIPQMLASNADAQLGDGSESSSSVVSTESTTKIVNNITAMAQSGAAEVFGNTSSGSALSGDALSNVVIFNLSGHEIIAKNSLLVFVNVLGRWVGVIVDAPTGATAALIGNGVTSKTSMPDMMVNAASTHGITNSISVVAQSGDAEVSYNTVAGSAVSGQARAMANIANVSGSQFGLTDWFGVLFINVFQNWYGSFGVNTAYGNPLEPPVVPQGPIAFVPAEPAVPVAASTQRVGSSGGTFTTGRTTLAVFAGQEPSTVLAAATRTASAPVSTLDQSVELPNEMAPGVWVLVFVATAMLVGLGIAGARRLRALS